MHYKAVGGGYCEYYSQKAEGSSLSSHWTCKHAASFMLIFKQKHGSVTHSWSRGHSPLAQPPSSSSPPAHTSVRHKKLRLYELITDASKLKRVSSRRRYDQRCKRLFWQPMTVIGSSSCRQRGKIQIIKKEKPVPLWEGGPLKFLSLFCFPGSCDKCVTSSHLTCWS